MYFCSCKRKEMAGKSSPAPDWAFLLPEILQLIAIKLIDIYDYSGFCCICTLCGHAAASTDLPSPATTPMARHHFPKDKLNDTITFFLLSDKLRHVYSLDIERPQWQFVVSARNSQKRVGRGTFEAFLHSGLSLFFLRRSFFLR